MSERTFSIIKPDAVKKGDAGAILAEIEKAGFKIVSIKKISISKAQAEGFYHVHAARPFFGELTEFMSSGAIVPMVLEKDNAIADLRKLMGATDPAKAEKSVGQPCCKTYEPYPCRLSHHAHAPEWSTPG